MDRYFTYPRTVVIMESGKTKAVSYCSGCFSDPTPQQPEPHFGGGHVFANETGIEASWEFVRKTDHGDVYLIVVDRPNKPEVVTPVLFTGKAQVVVSERNLTVQILPDYPKPNE